MKYAMKLPNVKQIQLMIPTTPFSLESKHSANGNGYRSWSVTTAYAQLMKDDEHRLARSTYNKRCAHGNHIIDYFKNQKLDALRPRHLQDYMRIRLAEGAPYSTVRAEFRMIVKLLRRERMWHLLQGLKA